MSDYGCCTLSVCVHLYEDGDYTCDECPFYDPEFFRKEAEIAKKARSEAGIVMDTSGAIIK